MTKGGCTRRLSVGCIRPTSSTARRFLARRPRQRRLASKRSGWCTSWPPVRAPKLGRPSRVSCADVADCRGWRRTCILRALPAGAKRCRVVGPCRNRPCFLPRLTTNLHSSPPSPSRLILPAVRLIAEGDLPMHLAFRGWRLFVAAANVKAGSPPVAAPGAKRRRGNGRSGRASR
jgi:hypothetical protein